MNRDVDLPAVVSQERVDRLERMDEGKTPGPSGQTMAYRVAYSLAVDIAYIQRCADQIAELYEEVAELREAVAELTRRLDQR